MKRLWLLALSLLMLLVRFPLVSAEMSNAVGKPNVLIILADDMGFSDASCYGGEISTPNLDGLAQGGLRFTQFYNTARCWPTRAAILTGYYAQQVRRDTVPGVKSGGQGVRPTWARLLSEMLRPIGYRSYHSGKWHLDGKPLQNGFDRSYSLEDHDRNFAPRRHTENDMPLPAVKPGSDYYTTTAIANHAIKCLKEHAAKYPRQPFFEYLAFTAPHFPLQAPAEDIARYRDKYRRGWDVMRNERWQRMHAMGIGGDTLSAIERDVGPPYHFPEALKKLGANEVNRPLPWDELTPAQQEFQANKMAIHAAMVDRMDREIGRVLDQIRAMGALENTIILFLSDNGASAEMMVRGDGHDPEAQCGTGATFLSLGPGWSSMANTPFRRHKTWVHEGGIVTPLIVHWPSGIAARGELRHMPGHVIDVVPTILQLVGGEAQGRVSDVPPLPGKSLVPLFKKDGIVTRDALWWLHEGNRALRVGDWKIVAAGTNGAWQLYDLSKDRSESRNMATEKPEKVRELSAVWQRLTEEHAALARKDLAMASASSPNAKADTKVEGATKFPCPENEIARYTAYRVHAAIDVDGRLDEPAWKQAPLSPRFIDILSGARTIHDTRAALLWDDQNLYVAYRVEEPFVRAKYTNRNDPIYYDNDVELFIAGRDAYYEFEINAFNTTYEVFFIWNEAYQSGGFAAAPEFAREKLKPFNGVDFKNHPRGGRLGQFDWTFPGKRTAVWIDGTINDDKDRDRGWTVELAFPWSGLAWLATVDGLALPPKEGDVWRMDFSRFNTYKEAPPAPDSGGWVWTRHGVWDSHIPECFAYIRFTTNDVSTGTNR